MRRLRDALRSVLRFVITDPVRQGSPQPAKWPWIGRLLGLLVAAMCVVALLFIIFAGQIRASSDMLLVGPDRYLPATAMPLLGAGIFLSMTLLQTAALHVAWPLRILALISIAGMISGSLFNSNLLGAWIAIGGFIGLVLLHLIRIGKGFSALELVCVAVLVFAITQVPFFLTLPSAQIGFDLRGFMISMQLDLLGTLAVPGLIMAGTALTQISVTFGKSVAGVASRKLRTHTLTVIAVLLLVFVTGQVLATVVGEPRAAIGRQLIWSLVILATALLIAAPFVVRARRTGSPEELQPGALTDRFNAYWFLVAAGSMLVFLPSYSVIGLREGLRWHEISIPGWADALAGLVNSPYTATGARVAVGLIGLAFAWHQARRGRWLGAVLFATFLTPSLTWLISQLNRNAEWSHAAATRDVWLLLAVIVTAFYLVARDKLNGPRLTALLSALAIMAVYPFRQILSDPISYLLGSVALAALIFGLIWRALTEGDFTRRGSKAFPLPSRVLLFLANLVFAATALARGALTRSAGQLMDPSQWEWLGDVRFAEPLYLSAVLIALATAWLGPGWFTPAPSRPAMMQAVRS